VFSVSGEDEKILIFKLRRCGAVVYSLGLRTQSSSPLLVTNRPRNSYSA